VIKEIQILRELADDNLQLNFTVSDEDTRRKIEDVLCECPWISDTRLETVLLSLREVLSDLEIKPDIMESIINKVGEVLLAPERILDVTFHMVAMDDGNE